jgi:hypothetical protein
LARRDREHNAAKYGDVARPLSVDPGRMLTHFGLTSFPSRRAATI